MTSNPSAMDPIEMARSNPYFKRNNMGKVTCTLCGIYCSEENNFLRHIAGKTHSTQLDRLQHHSLRTQRLEEEERRSREAEEKARKEAALLSLSALAGTSKQQQQSKAGAKGSPLAEAARFGTPLYSFRTEHDDVAYRTKIWIEVMYSQAEEGSRPLHRWISAREQQLETPPDDYFTYLLIACEGYDTIAFKFPASALRSRPGDILTETVVAERAPKKENEEEGGEEVEEVEEAAPPATTTTAAANLTSWDTLRRVYSMYFVLSK